MIGTVHHMHRDTSHSPHSRDIHLDLRRYTCILLLRTSPHRIVLIDHGTFRSLPPLANRPAPLTPPRVLFRRARTCCAFLFVHTHAPHCLHTSHFHTRCAHCTHSHCTPHAHTSPPEPKTCPLGLFHSHLSVQTHTHPPPHILMAYHILQLTNASERERGRCHRCACTSERAPWLCFSLAVTVREKALHASFILVCF